MFCRNCGKEVNEKAVACLGCGVHPLLENKYCPNCGTPTQANQIMCVKCGGCLASSMPTPGAIGIESGVHCVTSGAQRAMRICIGLSLFFAIMSITLSYALQTNLPSELQVWLLEESERDMNAYEAVVGPVAIVVIFALIVASVGLFMLKRWAAKLYLIAFVVMLILSPFTGPSVEHALSATLWEIANILTGMVLGLAFFSDALNPKRQIAPTTL